MKTLLATLLVLAYPPDQADKLATAQLQPRSDAGVMSFDIQAGQRKYVRPAFLLPDLPLIKYSDATPRGKLPVSASQVRPSLVAAETSLVGIRADPLRPEQLQLAAGVLIRLPPVDLDSPIPLPTLARPKIERASLSDPTIGASVQAALAQTIPVRVNPEPFAALNLPRPFEHRETVPLRQAPSEDGTPIAGTPRRP